jgi:putative membrane protein
LENGYRHVGVPQFKGSVRSRTNGTRSRPAEDVAWNEFSPGLFDWLFSTPTRRKRVRNRGSVMKFVYTLCISLLLAGGSFATEKATFVKMVSSSNKLEIDSSKLAVDKTSSPEVKAFAEQMIADHTKAGEEFMAALKKEGEEPPAAELTPRHRDQLKQLEGVQDENFDATYVALQQAAHVEAVDLFRTYAEKPDDAVLAEFAKKTLPTLEMHLDHAKKLAAAK